MKVEIDAHHLRELQFAARAYAHNRQTGIVDSVNKATAALLDAGVQLSTSSWSEEMSVWATDGNFGPPHDLIEKYGLDGKKARTA
jgi:hypothetical protein